MIPALLEACTPREDVLDGRLEEDRFAASIDAVAHHPEHTPDIYSDAYEFYKKTYPTDGLTELAESIVQGVLVSEGHETDGTHSNIIGLDTTFGGGKTHDLIAAYHLANDPNRIENLDDFVDADLADSYQSLDTDVNVAVIDGEEISGSNPRSTDDPAHPPTKTIWGEIVYQLFGMEGYREIEEIDTSRNAPSGSELRRLFQQSDAFNLILLDELALYLEDAAAITIEGSNLANQTTTFIFRLLGAISKVDNATVVYSISESAFEDRAEELREAIEDAQDDVGEIFKRKHRVITPTGDKEVGAVLKRRLFEDIEDDAAESFADAYSEYYQNFPRTLPAEADSPQYKEKLEREYPFHPELLTTLTDKVDSIPKFQQTRGALKLLAAAIHYLWENQPTHYERHVLRTYDLTPAQPIIRKEISELCEVIEKLDAAVKADVYNDDGDSFGQREDGRWADKGLPPFGSHITNTVLWNSLAAGDRAIGLTYSELYLQLGHPDLQMDHYDTARDNLTYKNDIEYAAHYLYDEDRVQFKGVPNVARMVQQEKGQTSVTEAENEVRRNVKNAVGTTPFEPITFPQHVSEIDDDSDNPKLCVLDFEMAEIDGGEANNPPDIITRFYEETMADVDGQSQKRTYKNYVLFLVPDQGEMTTAIDKARLWLAQKEVQSDDERYPDITEAQADKLQEDIQKSRGLMREKARTAYRHLYVPGENGDLEHITIKSVSGNGPGDFQTSVLDTLDEIDRIIKADAAGKAGLWVERRLWQANRKRMSTQALNEQFAKKPGLPMLLSPKPLRKTVAKIVEEDGYAHWDGVQGTVYWNPSNPIPDAWEYDASIADSPDVKTEISASDVSIRDDHIVYESMDAVLEDVDIEPPEPSECSECGTELAQDATSSLCEDCREKAAECSECGRDVPGTTKADEPVRCENCRAGKTWTIDEGPGEGNLMLDSVHHQAVGDDHRGLTRLVMEIHGGSKFSHLEYLRNRRALSDHDALVSAAFRATDDDTGTEVSVDFNGPADTFDRLGHNTLDRMEDAFENPDAAATIELDFDPPHLLQPEDSDEPDVMQSLAGEIEGTGLDLHVRAEGITDVDEAELEVTQ